MCAGPCAHTLHTHLKERMSSCINAHTQWHMQNKWERVLGRQKAWGHYAIEHMISKKLSCWSVLYWALIHYQINLISKRLLKHFLQSSLADTHFSTSLWNGTSCFFSFVFCLLQFEMTSNSYAFSKHSILCLWYCMELHEYHSIGQSNITNPNQSRASPYLTQAHLTAFAEPL